MDPQNQPLHVQDVETMDHACMVPVCKLKMAGRTASVMQDGTVQHANRRVGSTGSKIRIV